MSKPLALMEMSSSHWNRKRPNTLAIRMPRPCPITSAVRLSRWEITT